MEEQLQPFVGRWVLVRSENFDEFLKEMGYNRLFRKGACMSTPLNEIKIEGSILTFSITVAKFFSTTQKIRLNEEYEDLSENIKYKFSSAFENGVFTVRMEPVDPKGKGKLQVIHREIVNDELIMTIHVNGITCVRAYVKEKKT